MNTGVCNNKSGIHTGICMTKPTACQFSLIYVCGCDFNTYQNECIAHSNGVSVSYEGECKENGSKAVPTVTDEPYDPYLEMGDISMSMSMPVSKAPTNGGNKPEPPTTTLANSQKATSGSVTLGTTVTISSNITPKIECYRRNGQCS